jgi:hypothetical protein
LAGSTLAGPPGLPTALRCVTPATLVDLYSFSNGETGNPRLGPSKVPQPSVDLIYMVASARFKSLGRPVGTAELEIPTLSSSVLVWNGGGGVAIKEAWKERNPTKNVFNFANVESRYWGGLIKLSDSVRLHGASDAQAKVLKGAEKHHVEGYVIWRIIVAIHPGGQRSQSAREKELRTNNPHAIRVGNSSCNFIMTITIANVVGIRGDCGHTVLHK